MNRILFIIAICIIPGLAGCLIAPATPDEERTGVDMIGAPYAKAPVQIGVTKRGAVIEQLGAPEQVSKHSIGYSYQPVTWRVGFVGPGGPCGIGGYYPWEFRGHETLSLEFDESDTLIRATSSRFRRPIDEETYRGVMASSTRRDAP